MNKVVEALYLLLTLSARELMFRAKNRPIAERIMLLAKKASSNARFYVTFLPNFFVSKAIGKTL